MQKAEQGKEGGTRWETGIILPEKDLMANHTEVLSKTSLQWGVHSKLTQGLLELPMEVQLSPGSKKALPNCTSGGKGRDFPSAPAFLFFFPG